MINKFSTKFLILTVLFLFAGISQIFAQATGSITGVVKDANDAVIPNATVRYVNKGTGVEKTTVASEDGIYTFTLLQPGRFTVTASAGSFTEKSLDVEVQVGRTTSANFTLGVGDVSAVVEISAEGVQTTEIKPDAVLDQTEISNLPINGRRFQDFAILTPTAQIDPQRGQISLSGQRGINTNVNVDGVDYNQPFFGGIRGGERSNSAFTLPQEAIREFQVVASGYGAEYGRSSGGVINVVTKSGGNDVNGSVFYLIRPNQLARGHDYAKALVDILPQGIDSTLAPTQQQFGGSIGGPIVKDKLFYFGAYEQQRFRAPRQILFRNSLDVDPGTLTAGQLAVFNLFKGFEVPFTQTNDAYSGVGKIDWNINDDNRFNIRFNYSRNNALNAVTTGETTVDPTINKSLLTNGTEQNRNIAVVSQLISNLNPNTINDFRFQFAREDRPRLANAFIPLVANTYGDIGTRSFLPTTQFDTRYQITDALTYIYGNHTIKGGFEFSRLLADQLFGFNQPGNFNYFDNNDLSFLDVLSNVPLINTTSRTNSRFGRFDNTNATYRLQIGNLQANYKVYEAAGYAQDTWRINPKLTINYGLRVEKQFNPEPELGNTALINAVQNGSFPLFGGQNFDPTQIPDSEWQFGPRAGFAYDPFGDNKTVIRGFTGLYYARTPLLILADPVNNFRTTPGNLTVQFPFNIPSQFNQALFDANNPQYVNLVGAGVRPTTVFRHFAILGTNLNSSPLDNLPVIAPADLLRINQAILAASPGAAANTLGFFTNANVTAVAEDFENPRSFQFGFGAEREIARGFTIGVDYAQINTSRLERNRDINLPTPFTADQYANLLIASNTAAVQGSQIFQDAISQIRASGRPIFAISTPRGIPTCAVVARSCPTASRITIARQTRPIANLGNITLRESSARSLYRALTLRTRYSRKWGQINAYYVFSDSNSDDDNERSSGGADYDNGFNLIPEYGPSRLDVRHRFTASPVVFLPYDFELSSSIRLRSGRPVDAVIGNDLNGDNVRNDRPFAAQGVPFTRNAFRGNSEFEVDLRVQKSFAFNERRRLKVWTEFFNLFNRSNIDISGSTARFCSNTSDLTCGLNGPTNTNFLQTRDSNGNIITFANFAGSQVFQMQFGVRFEF
ncbi:MAG: TonB-dependent receptor [Acidobacteriota bacterium]|nr:TonB-dependent receptor [Acidobacteriota bacterium]